MKVLSIRQPWAWLIVNGYKNVENRDWYTQFRGVFGVHAGQKIDVGAYAWVRQRFPEISLPDAADLLTGGIIGTADLYDVVNVSPSPWFTGSIGFMLRDQKTTPFRPLRGQLGFFYVDGRE